MTTEFPAPTATPAEILETWLPAQIVRDGGGFVGASPCLRVSLSGPGGGQWDLALDEGHLSVVPLASLPGAPRPADPDVWLRLSVPDFHAVFHGDADLPDFSLRNFDLATLWNPGAADLEAFEKLAGRIRFEIAGRRHRRFALDLAFGRQGVLAGRPKTVVSVDGGTCEKLSKGTLNPLQALISGQLRVEGDRGLAMQVLLLTASRLRR